MSCTTLANIYTQLGQYEKAEKLYLEVKAIREEVLKKDHPLYASSCNVLADFYYQSGEYQKAEPLYLEAREIRSHQPDKNNFDYGETCNSLGNLYLSTGELKKAESFALEAKSIWTATQEKGDPNFAVNDNLLGNIYTALGQYSKAQSYFLKARASWKIKLGTRHLYYADNTTGLAEVNWNLHNYVQANKLYSEALQSQYDQIKKVFLFTNEREKSNYLRNIRGAGDEYLSFIYLHTPSISAGTSYESALASRNLILSSSKQIRQLIYNSENDSLIRMYDEWMGKKQLLAEQYSNPAETNTVSIGELEDQADLAEKNLVKASLHKNLFKENNFGWRNIHAAIKKNEACIEFVEFQFFNGKRWTDSIYYAALLMRKDLPDPIFIKLFEKRRLDSIIRKTGNTANENVAALYSRGVGIVNTNPVSAGIYKLIWQPLDKKLTGISKIYFAPAGMLHRIAFAALPVNSKQVLSDKYRLVQLSTTAAIKDSIAEFVKSSDKIYLYGGVLYDADITKLKDAVQVYKVNGESGSRSATSDVSRGSSWNYLPGTATEIEQIAKLDGARTFTVQRYSGIDASEESIKVLNAKNFPAVLHIASHGFFFPDPANQPAGRFAFNTNGYALKESDDPMMRSGVLLAGANLAWAGKFEKGVDDGFLTSYEVSNLYLPALKLVVLSACETALGDIRGNEGVYGLQRAFKMAGAENLIMSLWKVPDAETAEFMLDLYKNLFENQSIADAFCHTQQKMKEKYRNNPYKWGAWVLVR